MQIASFGDLHLGPDGRRERFPQREEGLLALCEHLEESHDRIILLGDLYQADYGWRPGPDAAVVAAIRRRFARVTTLWESGCYVHLRGNHDALSSRIPAGAGAAVARSRLRIRADGLTLLYLHGHQFDPLSRGSGPKLMMWMVARLRGARLRRLSDVVDEVLLDRSHRALMGDEHLGLADAASRLLRRRAYDVVVMGHSHRPACTRVDRGVYANSGVCTSSSPTFISIDTGLRRVELCTFDPATGSRRLAWAEVPDRSPGEAHPGFASAPEGAGEQCGS